MTQEIEKYIEKYPEEIFKFTPKGMLQIQINQVINLDVLKTVFSDTLLLFQKE